MTAVFFGAGLAYIFLCVVISGWLLIWLSNHLASAAERWSVRLWGGMAIVGAALLSFIESVITGFYPQVFLIFDTIAFTNFVTWGVGIGYGAGFACRHLWKSAARLASHI